MPESPSPAPTVVEFQVDGQTASAQARPDRTLLETLRDQLENTAVKVGCEMGNCGACTVLLDGDPVYSCLVLAVECDGRSVETAAALAADGEFGAVPRAFVDHDALQCGFCTPGQVLAVESIRRRAEAGERFDDEAIRHALAGNLCRCGAYRHILDAAASVIEVSL